MKRRNHSGFDARRGVVERGGIGGESGSVAAPLLSNGMASDSGYLFEKRCFVQPVRFIPLQPTEDGTLRSTTVRQENELEKKIELTPTNQTKHCQT